MQFFPFKQKKKENKEYHFGLFLREDQVVGFVYEIVSDKLHILAKQSTHYTNGWDNILEDIDDLLFKLDNEVKTELKKVIFFVHSYFIDENTKQIVHPYKEVLKRIAKELELKPLGYIECYEAVATLLSERESAPLNALLVELDKANFGIFVYRAGKKVYSYTAEKTPFFIDGFIDGLKKAREQNILLPSRLIVYSAYESKNESTQILGHHWEQEIFVQLPRVELLKEEDLYEGLGKIFVEQIVTLKNAHGTTQKLEQDLLVEAMKENGNVQTPAVVDTPHRQAQLVEDIQTDDKELEKDLDEEKEVMGFMIGADVKNEEEPAEEKVYEKRSAISAPSLPNEKKKFAFNFKLPVFSKFNLKNRRTIIPIGIALFVLIIFIALFSIEYFFHKATVTVYLPSQSMQKELVLAVPLGQKDENGFEVKQETVSTPLSDSAKTTGTKDVGEKAKGSIAVNNFDDKERSFSKGTIATADSLQYTFDQDIKVPPGSVSSQSGTLVKVPGKTTVNVTASDIGTSYNIDKGKQFKIADLSTSLYLGTNDNSFSGGTKKQVQVVSKKDADQLKTSIMDKAKSQNVGDFSKSAGSGVVVIDNLTGSELSDVKYSKQVGDEASQVTLNATVKTNYYTFEKNAMNTLITSAFKNEVQTGYKLQTNKINFTIKDSSSKSNTINLTVEAAGESVKEVASQDIVKVVSGKNKNDLDVLLKSAVDATSVKTDNHSPLFFFNSTLPFFKKNIEVKFSS